MRDNIYPLHESMKLTACRQSKNYSLELIICKKVTDHPCECLEVKACRKNS
jgi:hypothetical protein